MSGKHQSKATPDHPTIYQIKVKGHLDAKWVNWFEDFTIAQEENGNTVLTGTVVDQAVLFGVLKKIRNLGLLLLSVNLINPD